MQGSVEFFNECFKGPRAEKSIKRRNEAFVAFHFQDLCKFSAVGKPVAFPMFPSSQRPFNMAATALEKYVKLLIHTATFVAIKPRSPVLSESQKVSVRCFEV